MQICNSAAGWPSLNTSENVLSVAVAREIVLLSSKEQYWLYCFQRLELYECLDQPRATTPNFLGRGQ